MPLGREKLWAAIVLLLVSAVHDLLGTLDNIATFIGVVTLQDTDLFEMSHMETINQDTFASRCRLIVGIGRIFGSIITIL